MGLIEDLKRTVATLEAAYAGAKSGRDRRWITNEIVRVKAKIKELGGTS
jgi:hypothetical protein